MSEGDLFHGINLRQTKTDQNVRNMKFMKIKRQKNAAIKCPVVSPGSSSSEVNGIPLIRSGPEDVIARQLARIQGHCHLRKWNFRPDLAILDGPPRIAYRLHRCHPIDEFLQKVREGRFGSSQLVVIVENVDRLYNSQVANAESTVLEMLRRGVSVLFAYTGLQLDKGDENDPIKRVGLLIEIQRGRAESARRSICIKEGMRRKSEQLRPAGMSKRLKTKA